MTITIFKKDFQHKATKIFYHIHFTIQALWATFVIFDFLSLVLGIVDRETHDAWFKADSNASVWITVIYIVSQIIFNGIWNFTPWLKTKIKKWYLSREYNLRKEV